MLYYSALCNIDVSWKVTASPRLQAQRLSLPEDALFRIIHSTRHCISVSFMHMHAYVLQNRAGVDICPLVLYLTPILSPLKHIRCKLPMMSELNVEGGRWMQNFLWSSRDTISPVMWELWWWRRLWWVHKCFGSRLVQWFLTMFPHTISLYLHKIIISSHALFDDWVWFALLYTSLV